MSAYENDDYFEDDDLNDNPIVMESTNFANTRHPKTSAEPSTIDPRKTLQDLLKKARDDAASSMGMKISGTVHVGQTKEVKIPMYEGSKIMHLKCEKGKCQHIEMLTIDDGEPKFITIKVPAENVNGVFIVQIFKYGTLVVADSYPIVRIMPVVPDVPVTQPRKKGKKEGNEPQKTKDDDEGKKKKKKVGTIPGTTRGGYKRRDNLKRAKNNVERLENNIKDFKRALADETNETKKKELQEKIDLWNLDLIRAKNKYEKLKNMKQKEHEIRKKRKIDEVEESDDEDDDESHGPPSTKKKKDAMTIEQLESVKKKTGEILEISEKNRIIASNAVAVPRPQTTISPPEHVPPFAPVTDADLLLYVPEDLQPSLLNMAGNSFTGSQDEFFPQYQDPNSQKISRVNENLDFDPGVVENSRNGNQAEQFSPLLLAAQSEWSQDAFGKSVDESFKNPSQKEGHGIGKARTGDEAKRRFMITRTPEQRERSRRRQESF